MGRENGAALTASSICPVSHHPQLSCFCCPSFHQWRQDKTKTRGFLVFQPSLTFIVTCKTVSVTTNIIHSLMALGSSCIISWFETQRSAPLVELNRITVNAGPVSLISSVFPVTLRSMQQIYMPLIWSEVVFLHRVALMCRKSAF